ncbi:AAA family ATPase [Nonomuraea sp. NPDC026600]|uniref:AAA family ATPase n=1 Tax=Nonomuraea sp. NPDC026600 TaxID=3155363 RepID=UPI0033C0DBDD
MRFGQRGGYTPAEQKRRERLVEGGRAVRGRAAHQYWSAGSETTGFLSWLSTAKSSPPSSRTCRLSPSLSSVNSSEVIGSSIATLASMSRRTSREETSLFEVDLTLGREPVRYTYGFELSDERVEAEWLHAYPHGRRNIWFDREAGRPDSAGGEFIFKGEGFKGERDSLVKLTRPNALFLSVGATLNDPQLSVIHRWFLNDLRLVTPGRNLKSSTNSTRALLMRPDRAEIYEQRIVRLLQPADLGVTRLDTDPETGEIRLWHRTPDGGEAPLDFGTEESLGTHAWFAFLEPMLTVLDRGSVLLVDELDSSLHPALAAEVVRAFQDPASNPHNAQVIFTTHDATLLGSAVLDRPLNRDQVWITAKKRSGETELYPLTDAKPRKEENLERGYLRGCYGGVPRVTAGEIVRELSWRETKATA